jgi:hypothetical protein
METDLGAALLALTILANCAKKAHHRQARRSVPPFLRANRSHIIQTGTEPYAQV